jgi:hypothetical protein
VGVQIARTFFCLHHSGFIAKRSAQAALGCVGTGIKGSQFHQVEDLKNPAPFNARGCESVLCVLK